MSCSLFHLSVRAEAVWKISLLGIYLVLNIVEHQWQLTVYSLNSEFKSWRFKRLSYCWNQVIAKTMLKQI